MNHLAPSWTPYFVLIGLLFLTWEGLRELAKKPTCKAGLWKVRAKIEKPMSYILAASLGVAFGAGYWWVIQKTIQLSSLPAAPQEATANQNEEEKKRAEIAKLCFTEIMLFEQIPLPPSRPYIPNGVYRVRIKLWVNPGAIIDVLIRINADAKFELMERTTEIHPLDGTGPLPNGGWYQEFVVRRNAIDDFIENPTEDLIENPLDKPVVFTLVGSFPFNVACIDKIDGSEGN